MPFFSAELRRLRVLHDWTQEQLAVQLIYTAEKSNKMVWVDVRKIQRWERGKNLPSPHYRELLCELFGVNLEQLGLLLKQTDDEFLSLPFGGRLRRLRELRGWSQSQLAQHVYTSGRIVRRWESGENLPSFYYQQLLCELFGVDPEQLGLLGDVEEVVNVVDQPEFGDRVANRILSRVRRSRGWRQVDVAEKIGTYVMNVSRWERGEAIPSKEFQQRLCVLFGKCAEDLGFLQVI